jgi:cytochrome c nitrite reductase small subunit
MRPDLNVILFLVVLGLALGVGVFTFGYAKGASYLTNDPEACANCHVMDAHFDSWVKSSHRAVAVCNDCHTPSGLIPKYLTKASNGFWHSFAFTTGDFPDPLRIKEHNLEIAEDACTKCHADIVATITPGPHAGVASGAERLAEGTTCTRCHNTVGHWVR